MREREKREKREKEKIETKYQPVKNRFHQKDVSIRVHQKKIRRGEEGGRKGARRIVTKRARRKFTSGSGPGTRCAEDGFHAWALSRGANFFVRGLDAVCTTRAVCTMRAVLAPRPASQACGTTIAAGDARGGSVPLPRGSQSARAADGGRATNTRSFLPSSCAK